MNPNPAGQIVAVASGQIVAIASGKGGVGKTWFAITLAHALARAGGKVLLVDWDLGLANLDVQLGLLPSCDLAGVLRARLPLRQAVQRHAAGFDVLAGSSGTGLLAAIDADAIAFLMAALRELAAGYDHVICDLAAGLEPPVRRMAAFADQLLVVATDEPTSLTDAYAVLKLHHQDAGTADRARIVVNRAKTASTGARTYATLSRACQNFLGHTPELAGVIRHDDRVPDAIRRQVPFLARHPNSPAAADVEALAARLG